MTLSLANQESTAKPVAIIDCGSQLTDLLIKKIRDLWYKTEIVSNNINLESLKREFGAVIVSGSWASVHEQNSPTIDKVLLDGSFPVLGICYGMQLIAHLAGGTVETWRREEWVLAISFEKWSHPVFDSLTSPHSIQLTHGDSVTQVPLWYEAIATSVKDIISAMKDSTGNIVGIQWHPEADDSINGMKLIQNFLEKTANLVPWAPETVWKLRERLINEIRETVWDKQVLTFVSGGVDSTVCLALLKEALRPEQIFPVFIDNGFMRADEVEQVSKDLKEATWLDIHVVNAREEFLNSKTRINIQEHDDVLKRALWMTEAAIQEANLVKKQQEDTARENNQEPIIEPIWVETKCLKDVTHPEIKRAIIGDAFVGVRDTVSEQLELRDDFLLAQWTLSTDVKESGSKDAGGKAKKIKTHHNRTSKIEALIAEGRIIEPLVTQMKEGVRSIGRESGLADHMIQRNPFPGPGLAIRVICADKAETSEFQKLSPEIQEIMKNTGVQATILPVKAVWLNGDDRVYSNIVTLSGDTQPNWTDLMKIREELTRINGVCRVMYAFGWKIAETEIHDITTTYLCEDTVEQVRKADKIVHDEFEKAWILKYISQTPVASIPVGFEKAWNRSIVIRPFKTINFKTGTAITPGTKEMPEEMLNTIVSRIQAEVPGITRVLYDLTPKPPATTELE
jgi:GMP synthase (glutamine-hydrolysing)